MQGGAIKWTFFEPVIGSDVNYKNNKAGIYGDNIASLAKKLIRISKNQTEMTSFNSNVRMLSADDSLNVTNVQSGGGFSLYFALVDKYGTVVKSDNNSKLLLRSVKE